MKLVFIDIDTQFDFIDPSGALYVNGAQDITENLNKLTEYAVKSGVPVISTQDTHIVNDPEFDDFPPHCIAGSGGHDKIKETIVKNALLVNINDSEKILEYKYRNWIFLKTELDAFSHPLFEKFIERYKEREIVVYGVATEYCVKLLSRGLLEREYKTTIVEDAIRGVTEDAAAAVLRELKSKGAILKRTDEIIT